MAIRNEMRNNRRARLIGAGILWILLLLVVCGCAGKSDQQQTQPDKTAAVQEQAAEEQAGEMPAQQPEDPDTPATVFFASDYQEEEGWASPKDTLTDILEEVKEAGQNPEEVVFLGDYTNDRVLHDYQISPEESIEEIRGVLQEVFPSLRPDQLLFVQGNHDQLTRSIAASGLHEFDDYLVYVLNTENDFPWKQGKVSGCLKKVKRASKEMQECFDELIARGESRPVFIAGHVPLHFTARTSSRHTTGDNLYASLIFDVVNQAAESLDIVYLFGHNHSKGWDCYMGGGSVYRAAGDTLLIPAFAETDVHTDRYEEKTLRFTYLNGGYVGYYMNCGPEELDAGRAEEYSAADEALTAVVCEIWPDRLELTRYDRDGIHPLGSAGQPDPYKDYIDTGLIGSDRYSQAADSPQVVRRHSQE
ncbi:MAG: metallophosphoesterase [Firmicutes bacterium]|nr:metallophosphoesterase [Bacillota bacterium]